MFSKENQLYNVKTNGCESIYNFTLIIFVLSKPAGFISFQELTM